jgi:hypothetical protein
LLLAAGVVLSVEGCAAAYLHGQADLRGGRPAEVYDARTAPRARFEPTWVIHSDSHAVFPHVHGLP